MLDIKFIRENKQKVAKALKDRGKRADLEKLLKTDEERRSLIGKIDEKRAEQKKLSFSPPAKGATSSSPHFQGGARGGSEKAKKLKEEIKKMEELLKATEAPIKMMLSAIPNIPQDDVPVGVDESANKQVRKVGAVPKIKNPKDHEELGKTLDIIDTERATKISGSRFCYLKGAAASLQFALIQYTHDLLVKREKFIPIIPPVIVKRETAEASGHPEAVGDEAYHLDQDDMFLVGTSEQSILPMYKDEILEESRLPLRYLGYSTCFRREAGSYGKDVKGILRQHQFDKLEMFVFCKPENSKKEHDNLLRLEEELMKGLGLPYRVMLLSTGDMGFPSTKTFDIETWIPSQGKYRETHSCSNCTDYQTRNLNIRYKNKEGKNEFLHALNGTAFAIGRILVAILENNQQPDGSILVPQALQKYTGFKVIKK
ncbi:serine--tRNA ligase [Candidatus Parcubacteria bacterium]|nr:serine--tRNA ligase [Patescibacteria group bacterium]MCG2693805.1 serine--tRNA ligase [Candidatus Parcubacteria bacterium]